MKHFYINFLLIVLLLSQSRIGDWNAYTSPLHINNLTEYNNLIICATDGGLLLYNKNQNSFSTLTVVDQLEGTAVNVNFVHTPVKTDMGESSSVHATEVIAEAV